jgi:cell division protein ZapA
MTVEQRSESAMSQVTVTINGRQFRLACEDGQEGHLSRLAAEFDRRIGELRTRFGEIGDTRLTIMAALMVADELAESSIKLRKLEEELASVQDGRVRSAEHVKAAQAAVSAALNSAAERVESLVKRLNQAMGNGAALG